MNPDTIHKAGAITNLNHLTTDKVVLWRTRNIVKEERKEERQEEKKREMQDGRKEGRKKERKIEGETEE